jgi:hypothetical protein
VSRDELYKQFGPQLLEALTLVTLDEINTVRSNAGLAERTKAQLVSAIETKLSALSKYDWMNNGN